VAYLKVLSRHSPGWNAQTERGQPIFWDLNQVTNFLEKLTVTLLVKEFPTFYGTGSFITVFTRASHWSLFWARRAQSTTFHTIYPRYVSSHLRLCLLRCIFLSRFQTKILYAFLIFPMRATCSVQHILLGFIILINSKQVLSKLKSGALPSVQTL
jgi:hypothetical protein